MKINWWCSKSITIFLVCYKNVGLGSILFAITVDCSELNIAPPSEAIPIRQANEIIIAVPSVSSLNEQKTAKAKRKQIISFEDDENASTINSNLLKSSTPPTTVSLSDACLKYQEKERLAKEKVQTIKTDSTYERLMHSADAVIPSNVIEPNETDYIEPESPTSIKMFSTVASEAYSMLSHAFDPKEIDSNISKADDTVIPTSDSSSMTSNSTDSSTSSSAPNQIEIEPKSPTESIDSSMSSVNNSTSASVTAPDDAEQKLRIQELEERCVNLEAKVTALSL